jgi:hypothetical protein
LKTPEYGVVVRVEQRHGPRQEEGMVRIKIRIRIKIMKVKVGRS